MRAYVHPRTLAQAILCTLLLLLMAGPSLALPFASTSTYENRWQTANPGSAVNEPNIGTLDKDVWTVEENPLSVQVPGLNDEPLLSRTFMKQSRGRSGPARMPVASGQSLAALRVSSAGTIIDPAAVQGPTNKTKGSVPSVLFLTGLLLIVVARFSRKARWPLAKEASPVYGHGPALPALNKEVPA